MDMTLTPLKGKRFEVHLIEEPSAAALGSKIIHGVSNMAEYQLAREIIARSNAEQWDAAKMEWALHEVFESEEPETCLCGHYPIIENCVLRNKTNGNFATVGNCCVKKFMGLPSDLIFQAVKRVRSDTGKSLNEQSLSHALDRGWINNWEHDFYLRIMRKRKLTEKQESKKRQINEKFMLRMRQARPPGTALRH